MSDKVRSEVTHLALQSVIAFYINYTALLMQARLGHPKPGLLFDYRYDAGSVQAYFGYRGYGRGGVMRTRPGFWWKSGRVRVCGG